MSYSDFTEGSTGAADGQITSFSMIQQPVRGTDSPGNLWVRVTGIAQAFRDDPPLDDSDPPVIRGTFFAVTDPVLEPGDTLVKACATAGFGRVQNDDFASDFGAAIDETVAVQVSGGTIRITAHAAYQGDIQLFSFTFSADLLLLRPSLLLPPTSPADRFKNIRVEPSQQGDKNRRRLADRLQQNT